MYRIVEPLYRIPETNISLYVNYTGIKIKNLKKSFGLKKKKSFGFDKKIQSIEVYIVFINAKVKCKSNG